VKKQEDGILLIDKRENLTSHDIVWKIKKIGGYRKVGHAGTLDPLATGLLVILVNGATKVSDFVLTNDKTYEVEFVLGADSETLDITSEVTFLDKTTFKPEEIKEAIERFPKVYNQVPPLYSAVKVQGKALYKYARNSQEVKVSSREVKIFSFDFVRTGKYKGYQTVKAVLKVSKGTYIRSIAKDFGELLNTKGIVKSLRRLQSGPFNVSDAIDYKKFNPDSVKLIDLLSLFPDHYEVSEEEIKKVLNGVRIKIKSNKPLIALSYQNKLVAIYEKCGKEEYKAKRVWN